MLYGFILPKNPILISKDLNLFGNSYLFYFSSRDLRSTMGALTPQTPE